VNDSRMQSGDDSSARLVLGTAQLGMSYGIANRTGQPDVAQSFAVVKAAWDRGIRIYDTAQGYGNSELMLGHALAELGVLREAQIITKIDIPDMVSSTGILRKIVTESLSNLGIPSLYGLMWHREQILDVIDRELRVSMEEIIKEGLVKHWGISVYTPARALQAIETGAFSMLQIPANVLDHRFAEARVFERAKEKQLHIYVRSVFLQGLLLLGPETIPEKMNFALPILNSFKEISEKIGQSPREIALQYIKTRYPDASVIIGAETPQQIRENADAWSAGEIDNNWMKKLETDFACVEESIVDPSAWPK
jgi:aryl-alcohol dehydrogenase-like predicted oxidoreductase